MIEVFFSVSVYGGARMARRLYNKQNEVKKRFELITLPDFLSQGDISDPVAKSRVQESPIDPDFLMFCFLPEDQATDSDDGYDDDFDKEFYLRNVERLKTVKNWKTTIRLWVDDRPDSLCGMLYAASLLSGGKCKVMVNYLPNSLAHGKTIKGWIYVEPEELCLCLQSGEYISARDLNILAERWRELQKENTVLRVKNPDSIGGISSEDENWYDNEIKAKIPQDTFTVCNVVSDILVSERVPTECCFPALRLWKWVQTGDLVIVKKRPKGFFSWDLRKSKQL